MVWISMEKRSKMAFSRGVILVELICTEVDEKLLEYRWVLKGCSNSLTEVFIPSYEDNNIHLDLESLNDRIDFFTKFI